MAANNNKHAIIPDLQRSFDKAGWVQLWEDHSDDFNVDVMIFSANKLAVTLEDDLSFDNAHGKDAYYQLFC